MIRLGHDWKHVARKAWSVRLAALAGLLTAVELALPLFAIDMPRNVFLVLSMACSIAAAVSRVVAQPRTLP